MVNPLEPQEVHVGDLHVPDLHIFVNRRKFEEGDGVRSEMTGGQIAAFVNVPAENAIVRVDSVPPRGEVGVVVETGSDQGEVDVVVVTDADHGEVDIVVETGSGEDEVDVVFETIPAPGDEVGTDELITIVNGMHFLVTRRIVEGG